MPHKHLARKTWPRLAALAIEIPPVAYVAITGTAPVWVRWWLAAWLCLWLIATVVAAAKAADQTTR